MPPLTGGRKPHYSSIWEENHGRGSIMQRATNRSGGVQRVRRASGGRLPVDSSDDSTWEVGGATTPVDHPGRGKGPPGIPYVLSGKRGTADVPRGRMPGEGGNEDGNAGALCAPACPQHRGDSVGRKLPPPTVCPMQHAGPQAGLERTATGHGLM